MGQVDQFLDSLKRSLKSKNIIYKDLAKSLDLSESSVKRILSDKTISLERIEEICKACDISFSEICRNANFDKEENPYLLSQDEEISLAMNPKLLHFYILLTMGLTPQRIEKQYDLSNIEVKKLLLKLDKMNLIELHPKDRVKLKNNSGSIRFRKEGPIGKALFDHVKKNYLNKSFTTDLDFVRFGTFSFNHKSLIKYKAKIDKLFLEIEEDSSHSNVEEEGVQDIGFLMSFRPWENETLDVLKKRK